MTEQRRLPDDVARCHGVPGEQVCSDCLHRLQIQEDDPYGIYLYFQGAPIEDTCEFKL